MLEAEGEEFASGKDRGSAELPFACGSAKRCNGMSASVSDAEKSSDVYIGESTQKCNSMRLHQKHRERRGLRMHI